MKVFATWLLVWLSHHVILSESVSCDLACANGGYCTLKEGTDHELIREAQAGNLVEICVCRPGFTGVACENIVEECVLPQRMCHNGVPCDKNSQGEWKCDCSIADSISRFAGKMCRRPITEYCSGGYKPGAALSFCTNGGRCRADFIAAQIAPGDTSVNLEYQHAGCVCPPEFYGPHCEFLSLNSMQKEVKDVPTPSDKKSPVLPIILSVSAVGLLLVILLVIRNKRRNKQQQRLIDVLPPTPFGNLRPIVDEEDIASDSSPRSIHTGSPLSEASALEPPQTDNLHID